MLLAQALRPEGGRKRARRRAIPLARASIANMSKFLRARSSGESSAIQSCVMFAGSSESADALHVDAARHDTGVSSARRTSSIGSIERGSDHSDSNATRIESGT